MSKIVNVPITKEKARSLVAGEKLLLNGTIYTARDAAHKRIIEEHEAGKPFPMDMKDVAIYYAGPAPAKPGQVIGSCGPTTSGRMDAYAPTFMAWGETLMIGKGLRNEAVIEAMKKEGAVYVTAIGGAGALISKCVKQMTCIAYEDLGAEAIYKLEVEHLPVIVTIDSKGDNLYETGKTKYCK
ncbi:Fe-S-containing hydro-lyase [Cellulosilyticum lentocellum]|uniref:Hydro-lyase, Fe-S type, tartrate/fumarate subfamily, beta subunit n=1 Tax=Cellulosilyticum lentocellum (strain ATCC 49066 / DSM 5427 / NCIMB 11756 / RHM5) TaxID=642492 RepID=F2JPF4_CELLD|nr:Fe-S-containing hydro-lyase [Cellulosilyticum lentocellum]ADZ82502.1 hydro-lyase, Fe-S type, tartrate/fumarate subfamily, beta subunit [Cellulosilyticum lentocellum DSM 5427]